jgi:Leucine-rich repeat (LRR) protein
LRSLDSVKSIVYRRNDFQRLSIERIIPLLARKKPQNLEELRIVGCRIGPAITHDLVQELLNGTNLSKLSLVKTSMSSTSFALLCAYLEGARSLRVLDISSNDLTVLQMVRFLEVLEGDRKLRDLNLSWNRLMDPEATIIPSCLDPANDRAAERHAG